MIDLLSETADYFLKDGQWSRTVLPWPESGEDEGHLMDPLGFSRVPEFVVGTEYDPMTLKAYRREAPSAPGEFAVWICTNHGGNVVVCASLPDLLSLSEKVLPLLNAVNQTQTRAEEEEHLAKHGHKSDALCSFCQRRNDCAAGMAR